MTVEEAIKKLKSLPPKAVLCLSTPHEKCGVANIVPYGEGKVRVVEDIDWGRVARSMWVDD